MTQRFKSQAELDEEFMDKVQIDPHSKCWLWTPTIFRFRHGYHIFNPRRYAFQMSGRVIPKGRNLAHSCINERCVNPEHTKLKHNMADVDRDIQLLYDLMDFDYSPKFNARKYHVTKHEANEARKRTIDLIIEVKRSTLSADRLAAKYKVAPSYIKQLRAVTLDDFERYKVDANANNIDLEEVNPEGLKFKW